MCLHLPFNSFAYLYVPIGITDTTITVSIYCHSNNVPAMSWVKKSELQRNVRSKHRTFFETEIFQLLWKILLEPQRLTYTVVHDYPSNFA